MEFMKKELSKLNVLEVLALICILKSDLKDPKEIYKAYSDFLCKLKTADYDA